MCMCYDNECACGLQKGISKVMSNVKFHHWSNYKITTTKLKSDYLNEFKNGNFEKCASVITKYGIVIVMELKWESNSGWSNFSVFKTVLNGEEHTAYIEFSKMSERQLRHKAQQFIKILTNN